MVARDENSGPIEGPLLKILIAIALCNTSLGTATDACLSSRLGGKAADKVWVASELAEIQGPTPYTIHELARSVPQ